MAYFSKMDSATMRLLGLLSVAALAACSAPAANGSVPLLSPLAGRAESGPVRTTPILFSFVTLDREYTDSNRLTGINNNYRIVGYSGTGSHSDPNIGYLAYPPYHPNNYFTLQYPQSNGTIATSLNNKRAAAGYFVDPYKGGTLGFAYVRRLWTAYQDPHAQGSGDVTQILGVDDSGVAVGVYRSHSSSGSFTMPIGSGKFKSLTVSGGSNVVATAINGHGDIVGYMTARSGATVGFLVKGNGSKKVTQYSYPGATSTKFLGITVDDRIVGSYVDGLGLTHGFLLLHPYWQTSWEELDDPSGIGTTVATSINLHYDIVGYYVDLLGVTHGFLATPL